MSRVKIKRRNKRSLSPRKRVTDFFTKILNEKRECERCGLCCLQFAIFLTQKDIDREPKLEEYLEPFKEGEYASEYDVKNTIGYIRGTDGTALNHSYCPFYKEGCSIYDTKPEVCTRYKCSLGTTTPVFLPYFYLNTNEKCNRVYNIIKDNERTIISMLLPDQIFFTAKHLKYSQIISEALLNLAVFMVQTDERVENFFIDPDRELPLVVKKFLQLPQIETNRDFIENIEDVINRIIELSK